MMNNPGSKSLYHSIRIKNLDHLLTARKENRRKNKIFFTFNIAGLYSFALSAEVTGYVTQMRNINIL